MNGRFLPIVLATVLGFSLACAGDGLTREERVVKTVLDDGYLNPTIKDSSRIGLKFKGCRRKSDKIYYEVSALDASERPVTIDVCCSVMSCRTR